MWIPHIIACLGISDMSRFYDQMAARGYLLERSSWFADHFAKSAPKTYRHFVLPKAYFSSAEDLVLPPGWKYLTENWNHFVFVSGLDHPDEMDFAPQKMDFTPQKMDGKGIGRLFGITFFPVFLYYIFRDDVRPYLTQGIDWTNFMILASAILCWAGLFWSTLTETYEMDFYLKNHAFLPPNDIRYRFSLGLWGATTIALLMLMILVLFGLLNF